MAGGFALDVGEHRRNRPDTSRPMVGARELLCRRSFKGRDTGSDGHRQAAEYTAARFEEAGLRPAGSDGYFQRVEFRSRKIVERNSRLSLVRGSTIVPVALGEDANFVMRVDAASEVDAAMVFAGYGLHIPEVGHDDLAGLDVRGKVVLLLTGGPSTIPDTLLAHQSNLRWASLKRAGAIGVVAIQNPKGQDIPWERGTLARLLPSMVLADAPLDDSHGQQLAVTVNPAKAEMFFTGTDHTFAALLQLARDGKALPRFPLPTSIRASLATEVKSVTSDNVVGILPVTDSRLKGEYVVVSSHIDHLGEGVQRGDAIYNGAMDNATGAATLIETAAESARRKGFKRSIVFLATTAEEKALLGAYYYANRPTVPASAIVANLNTDTILPLYRLKGLLALGLDESDLAADVVSVARALGLQVYPDAEPERRMFVRNDHYSFVRYRGTIDFIENRV